MTTNNQLVELEYSGLSPVNDLSAYRDLFFSFPLLADVLDYENLPSGLRSDLWDEFDYAETNDEVQDLARPATYPTDPFGLDPPVDSWVELTEAEVTASWVAKIAHCMYHEVHKTFPWSIRDYDEEQLRDLLDPDRIFEVYDLGEPVSGRFENCVDYSPNIAYAKMVSSASVPASTAREAIANMSENVGNTIRHVGQGDPRHIIDIDDWFDDRNLRVDPPSPLYISRQGCWTSSYLAVALARSINVPAVTTRGYYAAGWHCGANFKTVDYVLAHGDDFYNSWLTSATNGRLFGSYADFAANIYTYPPADPAIEGLTRLRQYDKAMAYVSWYMSTEFVALRGWPYQYEAMSPYYTAGEMSTHYHNLTALTGSDGGGGPVPPDGTISIVVGPFETASWSVSPDPGDGNDTGTGTTSFGAPADDYTLTWLDTVAGYDPPSPPTEGPYTLAVDSSIAFGAPEYTLI